MARALHLTRPMWSVATGSAVFVAAVTGCYVPSFTNCTGACAADSDCAPGHSCSAGVCVDPNHADECSTPEIATDAPVEPDAPPVAVSPAGVYAMTFTNQENGCAFGNWMIGATSTAEVTVSVHDDVVVGEPAGTTALFLDAWLGSHTFAGSIAGTKVTLVLAGNKQAIKGQCKYTFDASFEATLEGDSLTGNLLYRARTNNHPSCGTLTGCTTRQSVTGSR